MRLEMHIYPEGHGQIGNQPVASLTAVTLLCAIWAAGNRAGRVGHGVSQRTMARRRRGRAGSFTRARG